MSVAMQNTMTSAVSFDSLQSSPAVAVPRSAAADGQLAKCESQLSDWVNCPSGKTPAGRAKIAEISNQIATLKAQIKQADERKPAAAPAPTPVQQADRIRFDGQGSWINLQA
jgi:outer membrane murein-binding lipoprotein Lpp